jgi:hypothetical protein
MLWPNGGGTTGAWLEGICAGQSRAEIEARILELDRQAQECMFGLETRKENARVKHCGAPTNEKRNVCKRENLDF